jgi:hypothetical protein
MRMLREWLTGSRSGSEDRRKDWAERECRQMAEEERLLRMRVQAERSRVEILPFAI